MSFASLRALGRNYNRPAIRPSLEPTPVAPVIGPMSSKFSRRDMLRMGVAAFGVGCSSAIPAAAGQQRTIAASIEAIEKGMAEWLERFAVPGASIGVVDAGRVAWTKAYGLKAAGAADTVGSETVFEAASLGKPAFAYLVLKLAEEQRLDLDRSIGPFFRLPDFADNPAVDAITPRIVLAHRTGLSNWRPPREPDRLRFAPGSGFAYSGEAYVRLQRAVESATSTEFNDLITSRLFVPWTMVNSTYVWRPGFEKAAAEGHDRSGRPSRTRLWGATPDTASGREGSTRVERPALFAIPNAAASLYTSVADYTRFLAGILAPAPADAAHLGAASLKAMMTPAVKVNDELSWGLGWGLASVAGTPHLWHWGNNTVYQSFITGSPTTGSGIVVFTNSANGMRLCREVVTTFLGLEHPAFRWPQVLPRQG